MDIEIRENEPLARYTSWKIGGPAHYFADVYAPQQLVEALAWAHVHALPVFVLGGGSNTLVADHGFAGLVVRYRAQDVQIDERGDTALARIDAGAPMAGTVRRLARQGYAGLEWAEGLPGTIGGALYGNAGCYGGDVAAALVRAWLLVDGETQEWPVARFAYGYRTSALKRAGVRGQGSGVSSDTPNPEHRTPNPIVLAAEFALHRADPAALLMDMTQTSEQRRGKTPSGQSCGSVFKNPAGDSAGRLIEAAGLKGTRRGGAEIAEQHANYIVNRGGATSADVLALIDLARERVAKEFGVTLELEVQVVA